MHIAYCTNVRLPSERAHGHQIAQVCDALVALGHEVTVFAPYRKNIVTDDYWTYYGADKKVRLTHIGSFDPIDHPVVPKMFQLPLLNALLRRHYKLLTTNYQLLYTRAPALLSPLLATGMPVILELHQLPRLGRGRFVAQAKRCRLIVCLTSSMRETLVAWGVPQDRVITEGDGVDLSRFAGLPSQKEARDVLCIDTRRLVVGYVGRLKTLGMEKGVKYLLEALRLSPGYMGLIVGGPEGDRKEYEAMAQHVGLTDQDVRFTGEVDARDVPSALAACDVLAMPFPDLPHYRHHMSPLKMFEYMAAERPIITSDLPTIRDVLSEETAFFCAPGDSTSLADTLAFIQAHPDEAARRAAAARFLVEHHTWQGRMKRILYAAGIDGKKAN
jgi:glycosyltransferase involved in cell wall biosynthesis